MKPVCTFMIFGFEWNGSSVAFFAENDKLKNAIRSNKDTMVRIGVRQMVLKDAFSTINHYFSTTNTPYAYAKLAPSVRLVATPFFHTLTTSATSPTTYTSAPDTDTDLA
jgi:hypothetical protein